MNKSETIKQKIDSIFEQKAIKDPEKILQKAERIGQVTTPKGVLPIWEIIQSRGSSTNFMPKAFRFFQLPNNGSLFRLQKSNIKHWKESGFKIDMFNGVVL